MSSSPELMFFPNAGFLGDKVVYEVLVRVAVEASTGLVVGIEWTSDPLSMLDYPLPPAGAFVLRHRGPRPNPDLDAIIEILGDRKTEWRLSLYSTEHTKASLGESLPKVFKVFSPRCLWDAVGSLATEGLYPMLNLCTEPHRVATGAPQDKPIVTLHLRKLHRDVHKNLSQAKYLEVARCLAEEFGMDVRIVGDEEDVAILGCDSLSIGGAESFIPIRHLVQSLCGCQVHIGGDSGPTHLAAALGRSVVTVERESKDTSFGPYVPAERVVRLSREESTPGAIAAAVRQLLEAQRHKVSPTGSNPRRNVSSRPSVKGPGPHLPGGILPEPRRQGPLLFSSLATGPVLDRVLELYSKLLHSHLPHAAYIPFRTLELRTALVCLGEMGVAGFSVSQPFKSAILEYVDHSNEEVRTIGAANTVYWADGWRAENTDWRGALEALDQLWRGLQVGQRDRVALLYGAGGVARAIAFGLKQRGFRVIVSARREEQARALCDGLGLDGYEPQEYCARLDSVALFVNATSVGAEPHSTGFFDVLVPASVKYMFDVVISPRRTALEQLAARRSCPISNGWSMLERQAVHQVDLFCRKLTGTTKPESNSAANMPM